MEREVCAVSAALKDVVIWTIPRSVMFTRLRSLGVKIASDLLYWVRHLN